MALVGKLAGWLRNRRETRASARTSRQPRIAFKLKYAYFRQLLQANDQVLEFIAELEDGLASGQLLGADALRSRLDAAALATFVMVKNLNLIAEGRYGELYAALERINGVIQRELGPLRTGRADELVVPLDRASRHSVDALGGKMANLGEVRNRVGLRVPDGFVITTAAFDRLIEHEGLGERLASQLAVTSNDPAELAAASKGVQDSILHAKLPVELLEAIGRASVELCERTGHRPRLAVRSSAPQEDSGHASFAGQYRTVLNVDPDQVPACYLEVVASLYSPSAIAYRRERGLRETRTAVGVMELVDAVCAGVAFSRDPARPAEHRVLVDAVPGQGVGAVDGTVAPDAFVLASGDRPKIVERAVAEKRRFRVAASGGGLSDLELPAERQRSACVDDRQLEELARIAGVLEHHFGVPQDVEWALDAAGRFHVLQSRPLVLHASAPAEAPPPIDGHEVLLSGGRCACPGVGVGVVMPVETTEELGLVPEGSVLVTKHSSPNLGRVMRRVRAIVTEVGGATGHMAILAREFRVPAIVGVPEATRLAAGLEVTVDATRTVVYSGRVKSLLGTTRERDTSMPPTASSQAIHRLSPHICPLHLIDPAAHDFRPEQCRSIHDVTRFVHEKTFEEMFGLGNDVQSTDEASAARLRARLPIEVYVFDLGGALRPGVGERREVGTDDLASVPLCALVDGLSDPAIRWDRPRPVSFGGFLSVVGESMVGPPPSKHGLGRRSFAMASDTYLNFATRAGYHFSTIDTYCGQSINKNYVQFRFAGGAAAEDRRVRRVRFVAGVMQQLGFTVQMRADWMVARLQKYPREQIEATLRRLGRLTVCTRQLDMLMDNDSMIDHFVTAFLAGDYERFT